MCQGRRASEPAGGLDLEALRELETILNEARQYSSTRYRVLCNSTVIIYIWPDIS